MTCAAWDASTLPRGDDSVLAAFPACPPQATLLLGVPHALFIVQHAAQLLEVREEAVAFRFARALAAALPVAEQRTFPGSDVLSIAFIHERFEKNNRPAGAGGTSKRLVTADAVYADLVDAARRAGLSFDKRDFVPAAFAAADWESRVAAAPSAFSDCAPGHGALTTLLATPLQPLALDTAAAAVGRLLEAHSEIAAEKRFRSFESTNAVADLLPWKLATIDATMPIAVLASRMSALSASGLHTALCGALLAASNVPASSLSARGSAWRAASPYSPALVPGVPRTPQDAAAMVAGFYAQFGAPEPLSAGAPVFTVNIFMP